MLFSENINILNKKNAKDANENNVEKFDKIKMYINFISDYDKNDYKYGSGWFDIWNLKRKLGKLNELLSEFDMKLTII
jgi:hypothetical protein